MLVVSIMSWTKTSGLGLKWGNDQKSSLYFSKDQEPKEHVSLKDFITPDDHLNRKSFPRIHFPTRAATPPFTPTFRTQF